MEPEPENVEDYSSVAASGILKPSTGTMFLELVGVLVLLNKYQGRISYPFNFKSLDEKQFFKWTGRTVYTHDYDVSLTKCLDDETSEVVFILLSVGALAGHVNTIYFFKKIKTIFRFEPHGLSHGDYDPEGLDNSLADLFRSIEGWTFVKHSDTGMGDMGCQSLEDKSERQSDDPDGFCASWNFWMIEYIMDHPDMIKTPTPSNMSDIYMCSCADLNPQFDPARPSVKSLIREYNIGLLRECLDFVFQFMPLYSHSQKRIVSRIDEVYSRFMDERFSPEDNALEQGLILQILYEVYDTLRKIDENTFTIHGCNLELCLKIMSEFDAGFERRKKSKAAMKKTKKPKKTKKTKKTKKPTKKTKKKRRKRRNYKMR
jgi:hypothetical protein